jgi:Mg-chelatase subunit ChlD
MEQERAPKGIEDLFTKYKRIGNIARGACSCSREQVGQTNGNRSSKKSTTERGTYVSKIGNKNMHAILS